MSRSLVPSLAKLRRKAGLSQERLAEIIGVTTMSISNYESGRNDPSARVLVAMAKALNVTVDALVSEIQEGERI